MTKTKRQILSQFFYLKHKKNKFLLGNIQECKVIFGAFFYIKNLGFFIFQYYFIPKQLRIYANFIRFQIIINSKR